LLNIPFSAAKGFSPEVKLIMEALTATLIIRKCTKEVFESKVHFTPKEARIYALKSREIRIEG